MTNVEARPVGRLCVVCHHADRAAIEADLSNGETSIRGIARHWEISPESMRRHVRAHLDPEIRDASLGVAGLEGMSLIWRLMDLADAAREVRLHAEEKGDDKLALLAVRSEQQVLADLAGRFGVTSFSSEDLTGLIDESTAMARVQGQLSRTMPALGEALAEAYAAHGQAAIATQIRRQVEVGRTKILETREVSHD
jgi:DNA-binding MarR family transcriptional regulator